MARHYIISLCITALVVSACLLLFGSTLHGRVEDVSTIIMHWKPSNSSLKK